MNIKSKLLMAGSALLFSATMVFGAITSDQLAVQYQAEGYSYITIKTGVTQIKVEAVKNGIFYEVVYDIETGAAIDTSTHAIGPIDTPDLGVMVKTVTRDFEEADGGKDGLGDDDGLGHDLGDDKVLDDDSADINGADDDSDDDHGGVSGSDGDHSGDDDGEDHDDGDGD